jgi:hypothetical protein
MLATIRGSESEAVGIEFIFLQAFLPSYEIQLIRIPWFRTTIGSSIVMHRQSLDLIKELLYSLYNCCP